MKRIGHAALALLLWATPILAHDIDRKVAASGFVAGHFVPPDVALVDQNGQPRHFVSDIGKGHRVVISFFYANCSTLCPLSNLVMAQLVGKAFDGEGKPVRLVSLTVDPRRDTPAVIGELAHSLGAREDWIWLTGSPRDIRTLTHALGMRYDRPEDHGVLFIVGDTDSGHFVSTSGMPSAEQLLGELQRIED
ncbi:MAG: hypothetical protein DI629_05370 [Mesorhizobium amorphae]|nr:MAG: hypothetical protein DI629_05370 [Mesorhizobium amorphae]